MVRGRAPRWAWGCTPGSCEADRRKIRRADHGFGGIEKLMKQRFVWWFAAVVLAAAAVSMATGCALFGGSEDKKASTAGATEFSEGGLGKAGSLSGEEGGPFEVPELQTIYFDFDRAVIRDDQQPTMRSNADAIERHDEWRTIVLEGNCDERGSEEYNLALGERRANSVKQYLVNSGIPASRIDTVSFGESKPAVQGHDEAAWKWNRRVDFRVMR
jgi:peptidoglycan-associated lipoprotein